ncbi:transposase [Salinibacter ruber]|uniref:transposase n=1 Tax=Salinibacter ruber TaxID=146919 RepID=UPI003C6EA3FD
MACAGPDPQAEQSGDRVSEKGISKKGNRYIRAVLHACVTAAIRGGRGPPAGRLFDRLKAKGKHRKALRSPVCSGLVAIVYGCWSNGERFDPQHKRLKPSQEQKGRMTQMNRIEIPARTETCRLRSPNEKLLKGRRLPRHRRTVAPRIVVRGPSHGYFTELRTPDQT